MELFHKLDLHSSAFQTYFEHHDREASQSQRAHENYGTHWSSLLAGLVFILLISHDNYLCVDDAHTDPLLLQLEQVSRVLVLVVLRNESVWIRSVHHFFLLKWTYCFDYGIASSLLRWMDGTLLLGLICQPTSEDWLRLYPSGRCATWSADSLRFWDQWNRSLVCKCVWLLSELSTWTSHG